MKKFFKQSGPIAQIVVFFALLIVGCLGALGLLSTTAYLKGVVKPLAVFVTATFTASPLPPESTPTEQASPTISVTLTPIPGQWTSTPSPLPDLETNIPTLTPIQWTVAPTVDLSTVTPTQGLAEDTPTPESDVELRDAQLKYIAFRAALNSFNELHKQLDSDRALMLNETWKAAMLVALSNLEQSVIRLATVKLSNPNYTAYASYLDQLSTEIGFMASAYRKALDKTDVVSLQIAIVHLQTINDILLRADGEYKAVKSRLATPALTLEPLLTPTP